MIEVHRRLWFKSAVITLEDDAIPKLYASGDYASITALSYNELDLPHFRVKAKDTSLIDLVAPEDDILGKMSHTTRNEIRRTFSNDELRFEGPCALTDEVYALYAKFETAQGRTPIRKNEAAEYDYFIAYWNDVPVSGISIRTSSPYLRIRSIFSERLMSSDKDRIRVIGNASRRLVWDICKWGKDDGYISLDMASVNLSDEGKKGITSFKMSFGGSVAKEYTYMYRSPLFAFFELLVQAKGRLRKALRV